MLGSQYSLDRDDEGTYICRPLQKEAMEIIPTKFITMKVEDYLQACGDGGDVRREIEARLVVQHNYWFN